MRIAVIGAGISGLTAAYLLYPEHEIVVYEANDYIGGHTHTVDVDERGTTYPVDTGFIVFNERTYPNFIKLLQRLKVPWQPSKMSFSVRCEKTGFEFSPTSLNALFARRTNLFRPAFYRMLVDIFRFRRASEALVASQDDRTTLGEYLDRGNFSPWFKHYFIVPMGAAIWSTDPVRFLEFPARYFAAFFHNHGILQVKDQPQWFVIQGGSRQYVEKLVAPFRDTIRLNTPVQSVRRSESHIEVSTPDSTDRFDHCILATHSDQALSLIADPTDSEHEILSRIPYQKNVTILHTDSSLMPRFRPCWASWNTLIPESDAEGATLTYNMNLLQGLRAPVDFCVSLNQETAINPDNILHRFVYHHPLYTPEGLAARKRFQEISGKNRLHFCGAYWGHGFHEDGVNSALAVCAYFGKGL
jgi:predicted NAD/FAD-binding protein